ncbi:MAG: hypothetical protein ABSB97_08875, partial [Thermoplasmata archaeon]
MGDEPALGQLTKMECDLGCVLGIGRPYCLSESAWAFRKTVEDETTDRACQGLECQVRIDRTNRSPYGERSGGGDLVRIVPYGEWAFPSQNRLDSLEECCDFLLPVTGENALNTRDHHGRFLSRRDEFLDSIADQGWFIVMNRSIIYFCVFGLYGMRFY